MHLNSTLNYGDLMTCMFGYNVISNF